MTNEMKTNEEKLASLLGRSTLLLKIMCDGLERIAADLGTDHLSEGISTARSHIKESARFLCEEMRWTEKAKVSEESK